MKKNIIKIIISGLIIVLVAAVLFVILPKVSDELLFVTDEYRAAYLLVNGNYKGKTKQYVFDELGRPDACASKEQSYHVYTYEPREKYDEFIFEEEITAWSYEIWKIEDPAGTHSLYLKFDSEGKIIDAQLKQLAGG